MRSAAGAESALLAAAVPTVTIKLPLLLLLHSVPPSIALIVSQPFDCIVKSIAPSQPLPLSRVRKTELFSVVFSGQDLHLGLILCIKLKTSISFQNTPNFIS